MLNYFANSTREILSQEADSDQDDRQSQLPFNQQGGRDATSKSGGSSRGHGSGPGSKPGKTPKGKTETRKCRLCKRQKPTQDWPVNCPNCRDCKQALDNIAYAAKAQNKQEWFREIKQDETRLKKLIVKYQESCPKILGSTKRPTFCIAKYSEVHEAAAGVLTDSLGTMMHRSRYLSWAQSDQCSEGKLSEQEAKQRWDEMVEQAHAGTCIHDQAGPTKEPMRVRIATDTNIIFRSSYMQSKRQEVQHQREERKATSESVAAGRRALLRDHEQSDSRKDFDAIAAGMNARLQEGGPSNAFSGAGVFCPKLEYIEDELQEEEQAAKKKKKRKSQQQAAASPVHRNKGKINRMTMRKWMMMLRRRRMRILQRRKGGSTRALY